MTDVQPNIEDLIEDPEMKQAFEDAQRGVYKNTLLTMWESQLADELVGYNSPAGLDTYDSFLRSWPWLGYDKVQDARENLIMLTQISISYFDDAIEEFASEKETTREKLFSDVENDWVNHKELYAELIAQWTALTNSWGYLWTDTRPEDKPAMHVAITIAVARLIGPHGLVDQIRNLKDFEWSDEDQEKLSKRIQWLVEGDGDE